MRLVGKEFVPYFTWFSRNKPTSCLLNPHCGAEGVPFMNNMTCTSTVSFESHRKAYPWLY